MKLVNVTNSYKQLVNKQLENTDAYFVKVYSAGNTTAVYSEAAHHVEVLIMNKNRRIRPTEVKEILAKLLKRLPKEAYDPDEISIIELNHVTEVSVPLKVPSWKTKNCRSFPLRQFLIYCDVIFYKTLIIFRPGFLICRTD